MYCLHQAGFAVAGDGQLGRHLLAYNRLAIDVQARRFGPECDRRAGR